MLPADWIVETCTRCSSTLSKGKDRGPAERQRQLQDDYDGQVTATRRFVCEQTVLATQDDNDNLSAHLSWCKIRFTSNFALGEVGKRRPLSEEATYYGSAVKTFARATSVWRYAMARRMWGSACCLLERFQWYIGRLVSKHKDTIAICRYRRWVLLAQLHRFRFGRRTSSSQMLLLSKPPPSRLCDCLSSGF